jgi:RNA polymerase sigma factor (sigma-70 family)
MDYDNDDDRRPGLSAADALPPEDWDGFGRAARTEAILAEQRPRLAGFFRRNAHPQDVADLVQESFRRFFSAKGYFHIGDKPGAYLAQTARTLLKERARSGARRQHAAHHSFEEEDVAGPDPHHVLEARDLLRRAEEALAGVDPTTRDVFLMHRVENLSYADIARIKGIGVKRVEKLISKAVTAIRKARDTQR